MWLSIKIHTHTFNINILYVSIYKPETVQFVWRDVHLINVAWHRLKPQSHTTNNINSFRCVIAYQRINLLIHSVCTVYAMLHIPCAFIHTNLLNLSCVTITIQNAFAVVFMECIFLWTCNLCHPKSLAHLFVKHKMHIIQNNRCDSYKYTQSFSNWNTVLFYRHALISKKIRICS